MKIRTATPSGTTAYSASSPNAVRNSAGGLSFRSNDAATRLINRIGVPNFNEPTYYGGAGKAAINSRKDLTDVAQAIITDAEEVAQSSPQLLLSLAWWSRDTANVRTTPVVLLAIAAHFHTSSKYVRKYAEKILTRADQVKDWWAIYDLLYCRTKRKFPPCMKRGTNDILGKFSESELLKYDSKKFPRFANILRMSNFGANIVKVDGGKVRIERVSKPIKDFLVYGKITNPRETPIIAARAAFNQAVKFDNAAKKNAIASCANWEVVVSKFGNTKEVWEFLIENKLVGYMALLRNLRNILNARVGDNHLKAIEHFLVAGAVNSKQLPTRFYSAQLAIEQGFEYGRATNKEYDPNPMQVKRIQTAIENAVNEVKKTLPKVSGATAVLIDASGSMGNAVSAKSQIRCIDAAACLAATARDMSDDLIMIAFGENAKIVNYRPGDSNATIVQNIINAGVGHCTNAYKAVKLLISKNITVDRIIVISDMETYNDHGGPSQLSTTFQKYRRTNRDCALYCINVCGSAQGSTPVDSSVKGVYCISGYSEKVLETAIISESGGVIKQNGEEIKIDPMSIIDLIKTKYTLITE